MIDDEVTDSPNAEFLARFPDAGGGARPPAPQRITPRDRTTAPAREPEPYDGPEGPSTAVEEESLAPAEVEAFDGEPPVEVPAEHAALLDEVVPVGQSFFDRIAFSDGPVSDPPPEAEASSELEGGGGDAASDSGVPAKSGLSSPAMLFVSAVVVLVVIVVFITFIASPSEPKEAKSAAPHYTGTRAAPTSTVTETPATGQGDHELPYTAIGSCGPGSSPAQRMADPTGGPWLCTRNGVDGKTATITLDGTQRINAISVTPGAIPKVAGGADTWMTARVPKTIQFVFNDARRSLVTMDTELRHGEVLVPVPGVLASEIKMLVISSGRPPLQATSPTTTTEAPNGDPFDDSLLTGGGGSPPLAQTTSAPPNPLGGSGGQQSTDPVDAQFAVTTLKVIGRAPA
ncbi:hypothetical protein [Tsukamurella ocularis]|uniref:hypothetical protein n=1 Tax=Tsukamurella ocularis TaxID=1970234 RepID=UPI002167443D|nr:hypothetical protein [Tsukamurella ocularis]MCS3853337.1 hypothetical protein [Tsukamurella ocularis]